MCARGCDEAGVEQSSEKRRVRRAGATQQKRKAGGSTQEGAEEMRQRHARTRGSLSRVETESAAVCGRELWLLKGPGKAMGRVTTAERWLSKRGRPSWLPESRKDHQLSASCTARIGRPREAGVESAACDDAGVKMARRERSGGERRREERREV